MSPPRRTATPLGKRSAQVLTRGIGRLTNGSRTLPDLLIAGGQRCGTTSMYRVLSQHPAICKPVLHKGVHFFDTAYGKGLGWYRGHFPLTATMHRVGRAADARPLAFESSPYYLFHPLAAARIAADLPGVRLLVLLRDPVERAYSAHSHELARGFEDLPFDAALAAEEGRLRGEAERLTREPHYISHHHQHHGYLHRGRYLEHLQRLTSAVGRDRLHVVDSHRFFSDPEPVYAEVLRFLDLPHRGPPTFEQHNARERSPLPEPTRRRLEEHFAPHDEALAQWLGWTPSWRR